MDATKLSANEQNLFIQLVEEKQKGEFSQSLVNWTERCFNQCVNDFSSKATSKKEEKCIKSCFLKQTDAAKRMGMRFAEENAIFSQQ